MTVKYNTIHQCRHLFTTKFRYLLRSELLEKQGIDLRNEMEQR